MLTLDELLEREENKKRLHEELGHDESYIAKFNMKHKGRKYRDGIQELENQLLLKNLQEI